MIASEAQQQQPSAFVADFDAFYMREYRSAVALALVLSGSRSGAEDLAQDAFAAAYRNWDRIGRYDSPGAWIRRVIANRSVSLIRRRAAEAKALLRMRSSGCDVSDIGEDDWAVWAAVRKLPRRQTQIVALRYLAEQPVAEIGTILEISENTVKTHLRRARETLARRLGEEYRNDH